MGRRAELDRRGRRRSTSRTGCGCRSARAAASPTSSPARPTACSSPTVAEVTKDRFGAESLERPALVRTPEGRWRLYVSAATPGTKHWRVDLLEADTPAGLATRHAAHGAGRRRDGRRQGPGAAPRRARLAPVGVGAPAGVLGRRRPDDHRVRDQPGRRALDLARHRARRPAGRVGRARRAGLLGRRSTATRCWPPTTGVPRPGRTGRSAPASPAACRLPDGSFGALTAEDREPVGSPHAPNGLRYLSLVTLPDGAPAHLLRGDPRRRRPRPAHRAGLRARVTPGRGAGTRAGAAGHSVVIRTPGAGVKRRRHRWRSPSHEDGLRHVRLRADGWVTCGCTAVCVAGPGVPITATHRVGRDSDQGKGTWGCGRWAGGTSSCSGSASAACPRCGAATTGCSTGPVAVKIMAPAVEGTLGEIAGVDLVRTEARSAARLAHPNVAGVHDFGTSPGGGPRRAVHRDGTGRGADAQRAHERRADRLADRRADLRRGGRGAGRRARRARGAPRHQAGQHHAHPGRRQGARLRHRRRGRHAGPRPGRPGDGHARPTSRRNASRDCRPPRRPTCSPSARCSTTACPAGCPGTPRPTPSWCTPSATGTRIRCRTSRAWRPR